MAVNGSFLTATSIDELMSKMENVQFNKTYTLFTSGDVTSSLTDGKITSTGKGFVSAIAGTDDVDIFLSAKAGEQLISGRFDTLSKKFAYSEYATKSDLIKYKVLSARVTISSEDAKVAESFSKYSKTIPLSELSGFPSDAKSVIGGITINCYSGAREGMTASSSAYLTVMTNTTGEFMVKIALFYI